MVDLTKAVTDGLPDFKAIGLTAFSGLTWFIIIVVVAIISSVVIVLVLTRRSYKYNIIKWEKVNGVWIDTGKDKAMEIKFGSLGQRILYWRRTKIYTYFPEKRFHRTKFYFRRNEKNNLWEDFEIKDSTTPQQVLIDSLAGKMVSYNVGIRKGLKDYFDKQSWIKENIVMIVSVTFVILIGVMTWLVFDKFLQLSGRLDSIAQNLAILMDKSNTQLASLDNICKNSGVVKVQ